MPQIRVKSGLDKGSIFALDRDSMKLGRDSVCNIQLKDTGVSREHAEIYRVGEMFFIRDLGSRNGTIVNDLNIEDELLREGDVIQLSNNALIFEAGVQGSVQTGTADEESDESFFSKEADPGSTLTLQMSPLSQGSEFTQKHNLALSRLKVMVQESTDPQVVLDDSLDILFNMLDIQGSYLYILDHNNKLSLKSQKHDKSFPLIKASRSIVFRTLKEKKTILTSNAKEDFRFKSENSIIMKKIASVLCTPLIAMGREIGVIYLTNGLEKEAFAEEKAQLVNLVAYHTALAYLAAETHHKARDYQLNTIHFLTNRVERDIPQLKGRGERVNRITRIIAEQMGLKSRYMSLLYSASMLHHIGYLDVSQEDMTQKYFETDYDYVDKSVETLRDHGGFGELLNIVKNHRSRLDEKGKVSNLQKQDWSVESQILALAVEVEILVNLPLACNNTIQPMKEIVQDIINSKDQLVNAPVISAFEKAFEEGLILSDKI